MNNSNSKELLQEIERLRNINTKLEEQNTNLISVIKENGLEEELGIEKIISIEEQICIDGINHLAKLFKAGNFTDTDAKTFDTLHKNLRMIQNKPVDESKRKNKPADVKELLSIVTNVKEK